MQAYLVLDGYRFLPDILKECIIQGEVREVWSMIRTVMNVFRNEKVHTKIKPTIQVEHCATLSSTYLVLGYVH